MKYIILLFSLLLQSSFYGQSNNLLSRKSEIEKLTEKVYSVNDFIQIADSYQMSMDELYDYPVIFPIKKTTCISSGFGMRYHPIYKVWKFHTGIDIPKAKGTPVYATGNGTVIRKGYSSGYGNFIEIKHAGNFSSFYAHLSKTLVNVGDSVAIAQQIACVGNTGIATGCHLHYEVKKGKYYLSTAQWVRCLFEISVFTTQRSY